MRVFIVLCLVAVACADHLGPDYHPVDNSYIPPGGVSDGAVVVGAATNAGPSFELGNSEASFVVSSSGPSFAATGAGNTFEAANSGSSFVSASSGPSFAATSSGNSFGASGSGPAYAATNSGNSFATTKSGSDVGVSQGSFESASNGASFVSGGLEKEFYTFTADEQDFNDGAASNQLSNSVKQGLRVVFIKGPESSGLENALVGLAKNSAEQKTDIYVLSKTADLSGLANKLNTESNNVINKPEVHFVKYRTQEDAAHAQQAIQAQYDSLGGASQHFDGGVASSLNFASQAPVAASAAYQGSIGSVRGAASGSIGAAGFGSNGGSVFASSGGVASGSNGAAGFGSNGGSVFASNGGVASGSIGAVGFSSNGGSVFASNAGAASGSVGAAGGSHGGSVFSSDGGAASGSFGGAATGNVGSTYLPASVLRLVRF